MTEKILEFYLLISIYFDIQKEKEEKNRFITRLGKSELEKPELKSPSNDDYDVTKSKL